MCVCVRARAEEVEVRGMIDDKFVYINIVCFDVESFSLSMKCTLLGLTGEMALNDPIVIIIYYNRVIIFHVKYKTYV